MSCADIMYQPYATSLHYQRPPEQAYGVPRMHEPLDLGSYNGSGANTSPVKEEEELDKDSQPKETHYLSANCVLFTYFSGDTSSVVDEHFSRALSQPSSYNAENQGSKPPPCKDNTLMSQRNFPPSFWNSSYQPSSSLSGSYTDFQLSSNPYLSSSLHGLSGLHQDPWHHSLSSQAHSYSHRAMPYDFSYSSMASSRLGANYGSLLMQPSMRTGQFSAVPGQCDIGKTAEMTSRFGDHRLGSNFSSHPSYSGLESSVQESSKDLYWF